jgi:hypothetical protein
MALGVPGRLRPRIILIFGTTRVIGRQPYAPAAFTPGEIPGTHFQGLTYMYTNIQNKTILLTSHRFFHSLLKTFLLLCGLGLNFTHMKNLRGAPRRPFRQGKESRARLNWKPLHMTYEHVLQ